jgi:hypothetical protein
VALLAACFVLLFNPEDGGSIFLVNINIYPSADVTFRDIILFVLFFTNTALDYDSVAH